MPNNDELKAALTEMENALARTVDELAQRATPAEMERLLRLIVQKEIIIEQLLSYTNGEGGGTPPTPPTPTCPCKFWIDIQSYTTITITTASGETIQDSGEIQFSAEQCFDPGTTCNPSVDNFQMTFQSPQNTAILSEGRRGTIACFGASVATLQNGNATASGNLISGPFTVDFSFIVSQSSFEITVSMTARGADNTTLDVEFTTGLSPNVFVGDCEEAYNPG